MNFRNLNSIINAIAYFQKSFIEITMFPEYNDYENTQDKLEKIT